MFIHKRGRPKVRKQNADSGTQQCTSSDMDTVLLLFRLKKINQQHCDAAKIYEVLYSKYHRSIEAPKSAQAKFELASTAKIHASEDDEIIFKHWIKVRNILFDIHKDCESIVQKVVMEGMKQDLLNPTNITQNNMSIFKKGLEAIYVYAIQNTYLSNFI